MDEKTDFGVQILAFAVLYLQILKKIQKGMNKRRIWASETMKCSKPLIF